MILAPSYKRADGLLTHKWLPGVLYAVHEFEADAYRKAVGHDLIVTMPNKIKGNIARVRNWLLNYAIESYAEELLIIDDDVRHLKQWEACKTRKLEGGDALEFIEHGFMLCREWGARLWGVNPSSDKGSYRENTPFACRLYISGSWHGFDLNAGFPFRYDEKLPLKEDYDLCLQVLNEDRKTLRINSVHMMKEDHGNTGGCAAYRTVEREVEQLEMLQRKWGTRIVCKDGGESRVRRKRQPRVDLNPIIKPPIGGV